MLIVRFFTPDAALRLGDDADVGLLATGRAGMRRDVFHREATITLPAAWTLVMPLGFVYGWSLRNPDAPWIFPAFLNVALIRASSSTTCRTGYASHRGGRHEDSGVFLLPRAIHRLVTVLGYVSDLPSDRSACARASRATGSALRLPRNAAGPRGGRGNDPRLDPCLGQEAGRRAAAAAAMGAAPRRAGLRRTVSACSKTAAYGCESSRPERRANTN